VRDVPSGLSLAAIRALAAKKLEKKLSAPLQSPVLAAYRAAGYRTTTHGHSVSVRVARTASVDSSVSRANNSTVGLPNSYNNGFGVNCSTHALSVRRNWLESVYARGVAVVDGLLTLDAQPTDSPDTLRALWVEQSRGTSLVSSWGYLVRAEGGPWVHSATERGCAKAQRDSAARIESYQRQQSSERAELEAAAYLTITLADARAAGLCESGIRDWCGKRGIEVDLAINGRQLLTIARASGDRVALVERVVRRLLSARAA
jgi:hypothetical protein